MYRTLLVAGERLPAGLKELVAPAVVKRLPCSRQTSRTLRSPFNPANTISSFCLAVQLRYFLCTLNPISLSVERPMLSPTPDSLSGGYAPSEPARPKSATRQHASGERSSHESSDKPPG